ncbi:MAG TPA: pyridoxal phosphate-dependent aminotransferase [Candidatus Omnitrophota bacterium]|nr:pyridoxal phosphate-dependent aminotransferase [Candidatus Omnitrophota bacterium]
MKKDGIPVLDLTESNPTRCGIDYQTEDWLAPLADEKNLIYAPDPKGNEAARKAVSEYYRSKRADVRPDSVFLTAGTSEAYSFLFRLLANPGDNILIPRPSYPLFDFLADLHDLRLKPYPLRYDGSWFIDLPELKKSVDPGTKAVLIVSPNNPTGSFLKREELSELNKIAAERKIALISDEVFSDYFFAEDASRAETAAVNQRALSFALSGISKILGFPQMKLGWIAVAGPDEEVCRASERLEIIADTFLSVNTPVQTALPAWLAKRALLQGQINGRISENLTFIRQKITRGSPAELLAVEGGWYATLRLPSVRSGEAWALEFLEQDRIYTHPGYFFDFPGEAYLVLSLLPPSAVFREAVSLIAERIGKD